jgi:hypothetical protein
VREGFEGSYDAVRRYAARWTEARRKDAGDGAPAFIPLMFQARRGLPVRLEPRGCGDRRQADAGEGGAYAAVRVAGVYVRAYPRETQEMVFDAHARGFAFFGGVPTARHLR